MIQLFNTYSQKKEPFEPIEPGKAFMYVCGPTVYNDPHIGNARPMVVFDLLKRTMEANGLEVTYVSNYTDVDDKIIQEAMKRGISEKELTAMYIDAYEGIQRELNVIHPDFTPKASETMDQIIEFIEKLIEKGAAYQKDGDVFYRVKSNPEYGEISHQKPEDLIVGARIEKNDKKENPLDFVLWKETDQGIKWDSPWSKGRPGWHSECVVMIQDVFKKNRIDIHGGGGDLKFPHHENENAQARSLCGELLANNWIHNGMINVDQKKMSKSLGNVWLVKDLLEHYPGKVIRWLLLSTHYRAPLNLSSASLENAQKEVSRLENTFKKANSQLQLNQKLDASRFDQESFDEFLNYLSDDLNAPNAISTLFKIQKELNTLLRGRNADWQAVNEKFQTFKKMLDLLGMSMDDYQVDQDDLDLYKQWKEASAAKDYEKADLYRRELMQKGLL